MKLPIVVLWLLEKCLAEALVNQPSRPNPLTADNCVGCCELKETNLPCAVTQARCEGEGCVADYCRSFNYETDKLDKEGRLSYCGSVKDVEVYRKINQPEKAVWCHGCCSSKSNNLPCAVFKCRHSRKCRLHRDRCRSFNPETDELDGAGKVSTCSRVSNVENYPLVPIIKLPQATENSSTVTTTAEEPKNPIIQFSRDTVTSTSTIEVTEAIKLKPTVIKSSDYGENSFPCPEAKFEEDRQFEYETYFRLATDKIVDIHSQIDSKRVERVSMLQYAKDKRSELVEWIQQERNNQRPSTRVENTATPCKPDGQHRTFEELADKLLKIMKSLQGAANAECDLLYFIANKVDGESNNIYTEKANKVCRMPIERPDDPIDNVPAITQAVEFQGKEIAKNVPYIEEEVDPVWKSKH